jgi:2-polyprenyl-3-methyl-5-hydroxy-6-metoxy-1,4-benzoquinol methylase
MTVNTAQKTYWDSAGDAGYQEAMFKDGDVGRYIMSRIWNCALEYSDAMNVPRDGRVMDLGCGDGAFANSVLAPNFKAVEGYDLADHAIARANAARTTDNIEFHACDITKLDPGVLGKYDAVFMIGILHHVKPAALDVLKFLGRITDKLIILEPNGNHIVRKLLEKTPSYKAAGEDSFRKKELIALLNEAGFKQRQFTSINLFPNFTPGFVFKTLKPLETLVEGTPALHFLCTNRMLAFAK